MSGKLDCLDYEKDDDEKWSKSLWKFVSEKSAIDKMIF